MSTPVDPPFAAEEEVEATKPQPAATGANRTLLAKSAKTDPPPLFAKLLSGGHRHTTESEHENGECSFGFLYRLASVTFPEALIRARKAIPTPRNVFATPEPKIKGETVDINQRMKGIVHVNFYDKLDHKKSLRQVIVDDFPVQFSTTANGSKKYSALLSQLIPAAIRNDSPIKERSGRLYRPNIRDDPQHHHLSKIDALLDGSASALKVNAMNEYILRTSDEGTFECDIFWDQRTGSAIASQTGGDEGHTENSKKHERAGGGGIKG
ncbi:hypothetical protein MVEN_01415900 [Mycena venus]|uniref:Uncharacterized protein n=1 Tax=Mycena venus TaxID=2733690 RepID=A0A8H6XZ61_9AGAR|nr:hypothetical protein MVEN_01415900 [Mycena venus]